MTLHAETILFESLFVLALVFAAGMYWLSRNKEQIRFRRGFTENERPRKTNSFLSSLITQPDNSRVWGTDHSGWDGNVNFAVTRARGASFTIIKASEGTVPIKYYNENTAAARAAGLVTGGYHWLHKNANVSCAKQAETAWNRIKGYSNQLPLMIDLEWTRYNGVAANPNYADLELFVDAFTKLSGYKPAMYSAPGYLSPLGPIPKRLRDKLAYIVIASYYVDTPSYPDWLFHQFTDLGDAETIAPNDVGKKETDLLYFKGTYAALAALAGLTTDPTPIPPIENGDTMQYRFIVETRERTSPNATITTNITGRLYKVGEIVEAVILPPVSVTEQWMRLANDNYTAYRYGGTLRVVAIDPDPAPADEIRLRLSIPITATFNGREYVKVIEVDTVLDLVD